MCNTFPEGFLDGSAVKKRKRKKKFLPQCKRCRRHGFHPWVRKIPGEENGYLLQYSCLENPMDRGVWWAVVHRVKKELDTA